MRTWNDPILGSWEYPTYPRPLPGIPQGYGTTLVHFCAGAVGILWFALWLLVGFSAPASHPRITKKERHYIESSIGEPEHVC